MSNEPHITDTTYIDNLGIDYKDYSVLSRHKRNLDVLISNDNIYESNLVDTNDTLIQKKKKPKLTEDCLIYFKLKVFESDYRCEFVNEKLEYTEKPSNFLPGEDYSGPILKMNTGYNLRMEKYQDGSNLIKGLLYILICFQPYTKELNNFSQSI